MIKKFNPDTISSTLEVFTRAQSAYLAIFMMGVAHVTSSVLSWQISVTAYCGSKEEAFKVRNIMRRYQQNGDPILIDHLEDDKSNFWSCEMRFNILDRFVKE